MTRGLLSGLVAASVLLAVGHGLAASAAEPILLPVVLPDLSGMHKAVQEQFREAYAALQMTLQSGTQEPASEPQRGERSAAYGELGKLLMAGKHLDVAERCFQNAQMLAPDDFR